VLAESAVILGLATVVGVALLLLSANLLNDLTYKVSVRDPGTLAGSLLVIAVAIAMASLVPASRAGQVDIRRMLSQ
jgi:ABC-type antimicrobial peptide transport system permease subunit